MILSKAIFVNECGGSEALSYQDYQVGDPGPGEALVRNTAIGVNYIDTYYRSGLYPAALPLIPGDQAAAVVEAVGTGVTEFKPGDRVAYASKPLGAYAQERLIDADLLVPLPESISDNIAGATLTRGLTAEYLIHRLYELRAGETVLVHAAAGGAGRILCQWADKVGARVIGTVGSEEKIDVARENGCTEVLLHQQDFVPQVKALTGGQGVDVSYDSIGKDTFMKSLDCIKPRGMMVSFGNASGKPDSLDVLELAKRGCLFLTRPTLYGYTQRREDLLLSARRYFTAITEGMLQVEAGIPFPLKDAAEAHRHLEDRSIVDSPILIP